MSNFSASRPGTGLAEIHPQPTLGANIKDCAAPKIAALIYKNPK
jgi:hypothetical protein